MPCCCTDQLQSHPKETCCAARGHEQLDVWNPYLQKNMNTLEDVQKVALRMCSKYWDKAYCSNYYSTSTFALCKLHVHGLFELPPGIPNTKIWLNSKQ